MMDKKKEKRTQDQRMKNTYQHRVNSNIEEVPQIYKKNTKFPFVIKYFHNF
jgi:hypothetical protein